MSQSAVLCYDKAVVDASSISSGEGMQGRFKILGGRTPPSVRSLGLLLNGTPDIPFGSVTRRRIVAVGGFATDWWMNGRELRLPIRVVLQPADGEILARNPDTGIFGVGSSPPAALEDLRAVLLDHYKVLVDAGDDIFDDLRVQRDFLASHLAV